MDKAAVAAKLAEIFVNELGVDEADINDDLHYNVAPEWDSVGHMHLIAAIEEEFAIEIPDDAVVEMTSHGKVVEIVLRLVGAGANP